MVPSVRSASVKNGARLHACKLSTDALVDSVSERRVPRALARDVEGISMLERCLVSIGRSGKQNDAIAGLDRASAHGDLRLRDLEVRLHGTIEAQHLVHRVADPAWLLAQKLHLLAIACEREHAVADEVGRGFIARDHQHAQHVTSFHRADRIAHVYLPRERAHRIGLTRPHPVISQQRFEVASDLGACAVSGLALLVRGDHLE